MKKQEFMTSILEAINKKNTVCVVCNNPKEILEFLESNGTKAIAVKTKIQKNKLLYDELGITDFHTYEEVSPNSYIFNLKE